MKILGLDVGEKRIGVAKVDSDTKISIPIGFINVDGSEWQEITSLARLNNTSLFVLGLPRSNEGNETAQSLYVRNFAKLLSEKIPGARIRFQDESLTSVVAEERLKARKKKYERGDIDAEAAAIILEDFIEGFSEPSGPSSSDHEPNKTPINTPKKENLVNPLNSNAIRKEADKVRLKTKKVTKWISGISVLVILALLVTGGGLWVKKKLDERQKRQEYYAQQEAEMKPEVFSFTILPGETIFQIKKKFSDLGYQEGEINEAFNANYDFDFLKSRPEGASLEGFLFGDTHEFYKNTTVQEILKTFLSEMGKVISENNLETKYSEKGLSLFEGITLASIVQKEAPSPTFNSEQPKVAQVFLSRLDYGIMLGSDVTVKYALDVLDPNRETYSDNQAALSIESCYNTRRYFGLPCGPISNPGLSALLAVANPSETSYLYFLTGDDEKMYYSYTEAEHNQNIYSHCQSFCNISL
ncbi:endolytic transglycosylase MltG [Candidatus Saccharibacteria bacterium]|nr:endolytic transglycosylase MltG [Candidatus Saccharibacteria bacterium]